MTLLEKMISAMTLVESPAQLTCLLCLFSISVLAETADTDDISSAELETIRVIGQRVANLQPASTYSTVVTELRYDPQINIQTRGLAEGQADVTVRGGLFENTGFRLGAVTIFDPQTGHYSVELPIDPDMLTSPELLTDSQNGIDAFNATVATVKYGFAPVKSGGSARLGLGTDSLSFVSARYSHSQQNEHNRTAGFSLAAAGSSGDGTLPFGDHEFKRFSGHFQYMGANHESNIILGYKDKFFGWPGAYTGFSFLPETDHIKQGLLIIDHRQSHASGWWELGSAYRWLDDDYDFDRRTTESGTPGSFEHETRSFSLGLSGVQFLSNLDWSFSAMLAADRLVRSTDLTHGNFNSRTYLSVSLAPIWQWTLSSGAQLSLRAGLRADLSNRDEDALMPIGRVSWERAFKDGSHTVSMDLTRTSQLPGYTALNSQATGLFGGNPDLGREFAEILTLSYEQTHGSWQARSALFYRRDKDLVDWTFRQDAPFARQANAVDLDVTGVELLLTWSPGRWNVTGAYSFIDKDEDYGEADVDASYYALNFARHRVTLALRYRPTDYLEFRLDNEYRVQQDNPLRNSDRRAWLAAFSAGWKLPTSMNFYLNLVADNITDSDFEEFPGTPAYGGQFSLALSLDW